MLGKRGSDNRDSTVYVFGLSTKRKERDKNEEREAFNTTYINKFVIILYFLCALFCMIVSHLRSTRLSQRSTDNRNKHIHVLLQQLLRITPSGLLILK